MYSLVQNILDNKRIQYKIEGTSNLKLTAVKTAFKNNLSNYNHSMQICRDIRKQVDIFGYLMYF